uniref:Uncharacterized protein n=1 Tax=Steinernema glaseri TaxID=37863 RepID=A0A1I7YSP5_9BILA
MHTLERRRSRSFPLQCTRSGFSGSLPSRKSRLPDSGASGNSLVVRDPFASRSSPPKWPPSEEELKTLLTSVSMTASGALFVTQSASRFLGPDALLATVTARSRIPSAQQRRPLAVGYAIYGCVAEGLSIFR